MREQAEEGIPIVLVGNKSDSHETGEMEDALIKKFCQQEGLLGLKCSAKSNLNVDQIFTYLSERMKPGKKEASSSFSLEKKE